MEYSLKKIGIVGLGQIGGSIAMALKEKLRGVHITGCDKDNNILYKAYFVDYKTDNLSDLKDHDLIILSIPVLEIIKLLDTFSKMRYQGIILDTGSTKKVVCEKANGLKLKFVGGHPLAGTEKTAPEAWDVNLFKGKPFFICDVKKDASVINLVSKIINVIGAYPVLTGPEEHDRMLALTSHLPYLVSLVFRKNSTNKLFEGPGFRSFTRIAYQSPEMFADIILTNKENLVKTFKVIKSQIDYLINNLNNKEDFIKWVKNHENNKTQ